MSSTPLDHLTIKRRTIGDLVQFVKTRTDGVSNYTLLIGAGASVTSGIRSAATLVSEWRQAFYERLCSDGEKPYSAAAAVEFLSRQHGDWYSQQREYSSLFEKMFDLPRQRRMFVENEVSGKQPSIGYAYLIRLIEDNYFNTTFTTNFDDLLNEAFHQFTELRPIVCAHDSSISSITVTSKRPKIIKLHGDYLFDDIKSTVKETESLEDNTKRKFIEFSKEHGLIVIGYSGHDRSIMDVLHHLLKQEDYFKHGIYWCLRKGDEPSEDLTKLLWKDRAYWVEIEGFDELSAQLYGSCIGDTLPISTSIVSQKPKEIITRFCSAHHLSASNSPIIQRDLTKLRTEMDREALVSSLRTVARIDREDENAPSELKDREIIRLMEIRQLVNDNEYDQAQEKLAIELRQTENLEFKADLLLLRLSIEQSVRDLSSAMSTCAELTKLDPKNATYELRRAEVEVSHEARLKAIAKALELDPFYPNAYRLRASYLEQELVSSPVCDQEALCQAIVDDYGMSLTQDPSISNGAWSGYITFLDGDHIPRETSNPRVAEALEALRQMDGYSARYFRSAIAHETKIKSGTATEMEILDKLKVALAHQPQRRVKQLQMVHLQALRSFNRNSELLDELAQFDTEARWQQDRPYVEMRARVYAEVEGKIFDAIRTLEGYKRHRKDEVILKTLIKYHCYADQLQQAQSLLTESRHVFRPCTRAALQRDIDSKWNKQDEVLASLRREKSTSPFPDEHSVCETHALLKLGRFAEAEKVARDVLTKANFLRFDGLIINLELACHFQNKKIEKPRLARVAKNESEERTSFCARLMLDEKGQAEESLKRMITKDKTTRHQICDWAIFDIIPNRVWLTETLQQQGSQIDVRPMENKRAMH